MKETVKILGVPFTVTEDDTSLETNEDGFCNPTAQRICIRKGLCLERRAQVFLHEVIHAILAQLNRSEEYRNEQLIQGLAIGLQMALFPAGTESKTEMADLIEPERTCTFSPDIYETRFSEDGEEIDTSNPAPGCEAFVCSGCGSTMLYGENGWFETEPPYEPRFVYCPYCGSKVIGDEHD